MPCKFLLNAEFVSLLQIAECVCARAHTHTHHTHAHTHHTHAHTLLEKIAILNDITLV